MFLGPVEMKETELYQANEKDGVKNQELQTGHEQWTQSLKVNNQTLTVKLDMSK